MSPAASSASAPPIRLGTRRSALAMTQSGHVARALEEVSGRRVELVPIVSEGDTNRASLSQLGGTGVFATRLREALLAGECDLLVHSLKDLPTAQPDGLVIAANPVRADARDVVLTREGTPLADLAPGARIGTGSPRRMAQVLRANADVELHDLRGNVESRMQRVIDGELSAIVLAAAGLDRLDARTPLRLEHRDLDAWPTAAGQGALAVETRADADPELAAALRQLDDPRTRFAVTVERTVLAGIEAGCHAPVGVHARIEDDELRVQAVVYGLRGERVVEWESRERVDTRVTGWGYIRDTGSGNGADAADGVDQIDHARDIGSDVARRLLERGAADLVSRESPS
ncbi:hydroxymethylbilane synthase [Microbacterium marinilacus]|uniref:Hydroxymethylbilane synthase n=1 Tax=Microbacterium marinilacus TaxID=415209 RepID=A0ABP7BVA4_9MICO|nr:hydroxymethylbilane synthase [Microbacterium marinilacus]MBY0688202.1 hydroxymethylbilane synthase [Microbacterium marinilacus]